MPCGVRLERAREGGPLGGLFLVHGEHPDAASELFDAAAAKRLHGYPGWTKRAAFWTPNDVQTVDVTPRAMRLLGADLLAWEAAWAREFEPGRAAGVWSRLAARSRHRWSDARTKPSPRHWFEVSHVRYLRALQRTLDDLEPAR